MNALLQFITPYTVNSDLAYFSLYFLFYDQKLLELTKQSSEPVTFLLSCVANSLAWFTLANDKSVYVNCSKSLWLPAAWAACPSLCDIPQDIHQMPNGQKQGPGHACLKTCAFWPTRFRLQMEKRWQGYYRPWNSICVLGMCFAPTSVEVNDKASSCKWYAWAFVAFFRWKYDLNFIALFDDFTNFKLFSNVNLFCFMCKR